MTEYKINISLNFKSVPHPVHKHLYDGEASWTLRQIELPDQRWIMEFLIHELPFYDADARWYASTCTGQEGCQDIKRCVNKLRNLVSASGFADTPLTPYNKQDSIPEENVKRMAECLNQEDLASWCLMYEDDDMANRQFVYDMCCVIAALEHLIDIYPLNTNEYYMFSDE